MKAGGDASLLRAVEKVEGRAGHDQGADDASIRGRHGIKITREWPEYRLRPFIRQLPGNLRAGILDVGLWYLQFGRSLLLLCNALP